MQEKTMIPELNQLRSLKREVNELEQRTAKLILAAKRVFGSDWRECDEDAAREVRSLETMLRARQQSCLKTVARIYAFIDSIEDSLTRRILSYRYIDGKSWQEVAFAIGEYDEQYPRRIHNRFMAQFAGKKASVTEPCPD